MWRVLARHSGVLSGVDFNVLGNPAELVRKLEMNADIAVFVNLDMVYQVREDFTGERFNALILCNSTNINIRKLHNDKFDSKKAALVGLNVSLKASIIPEDSVVDLRNLVRDYYYFKDLQSAVALKLTAELKVSFPAYAKVFSKVTTQSSLKLLSSYPLAGDMLEASKDDIVETIRSTARFGEAYALRKYDAVIAAAQDASVFGRALPSNAVRIRLYIDTYQESRSMAKMMLQILCMTAPIATGFFLPEHFLV